MKKEEAIEQAKDKGYKGYFYFISKMFFGRFDLAGISYLNHLQSVMIKTYKYGDIEIEYIALGHDLFEDTDVTPADLVELGINARVIKGISDLTKWNGQGYEEYKLRVKSNPDAIKVKIADLEHNMDITRLKTPLTEKDLARIKRYHDFWLELNELDK